MKRVLFRIFLLCTILTLFVACGESAPAPEETTEPTVVEPTPEPVVTPAPVVEPEPEPVVAEPEPVVDEPVVDWASINAENMSAVEKARNAAVATGASYLFKDYFDGVDAAFDEAVAANQASGDPEEFGSISEEYVTLYNTFANLGRAQSLCNLAYANYYDEYDLKNAALGEALFEELEALAAETPVDADALFAKSEEILKTYTNFVANGDIVDEIIENYLAAEEAGAADLFPGDFEAAADLGYMALEYYNTDGTQEEFDEHTDILLNIAKAFNVACDAYDVYNEIYDRGLEVYDYKNIMIGDAAVEEGYAIIDSYYDTDILRGKEIYDCVTFVYESYAQSLANGLTVLDLLETRDEAIAVGADEFYPEEFAAVDALGYDCLDYFNEDGTQDDFDADAANLEALYVSFAKAVALNDKYDYILARGFDQFDVKNFDAGNDCVTEVYEIAFEPLSGARISENLDKADALYTKVINNGYEIALVYALRDNAIGYGAYDYYPEEFDSVDEYAVSSLAYYNEGGSQDVLNEDIDTCRYLYNALITAVDAQDAYAYIVANGYDTIDAKNVLAGDAAVGDIYELAAAPVISGLAIYEKINVVLDYYDQAISNSEKCYAVMAVRDDAVVAGAEDYFPEEFAAVDALAWEALDYYNAEGTQEELDADIENFTDIYVAFIDAAGAQDAYDIVIENGYDEYDSRNFAAGNAAVEEIYELAVIPLDGEALAASASDANYYYNKILDNVDTCLDLIALRDEAAEAGAEDYFPVEFAAVDELAWEAVDYYNAEGSQEELDADIENFTNIYNAFIVAVDAQDAYDVVIDEGYDLYDIKNVELGNRADERVYEIAYTTFDGADILVAVNDIDDAYNQAIDNGQMIDEVIAVRDEAIEEGADYYFPYELSVADEYAYDAIDYYNAEGTQEELEADAEDFKNVYEAFREASVAANYYVRIVENDFQSYDRNGFAEAEKATDELEVLAYSIPTGEDLLAKTIEVRDAYDKVIKNAFKKKSDGVRNDYLSVKKVADSIKASVADKQGYATAEAHMKNADAMFARMTYEAAFGEYTTAEAQMRSVYESVLAKRNAAMEALERGRARAEELSVLAAQADIIAPLSNN
ncbi:MAG: hypothetical protein K5930_07410 [Treponemataceae bacterium]|nr:hypothetical protein [Treponemataceae bacterium]